MHYINNRKAHACSAVNEVLAWVYVVAKLMEVILWVDGMVACTNNVRNA